MAKKAEVEVEAPPISARDYFRTRMAERYPDDNFDDDEVLYGRLREDVDGLEGRLKTHDEKDVALTALFSKDPKAAAFLDEWAKGADPLVQMIRMYGDDFRDMLDDPEQQEKLAEARGEYVARQTKQRELNDLAEKNLAKSLEALDAEVVTGGYAEEDISKAYQLWSAIVNDGIVEKVTPETWRMMLKAVTFDDAMEAAAHEGEVRGRNEKIGELRTKRTVPDSMPPSLSSGAAAPPTPPQSTGVGVLDRAGQPDIFDRGNFKRTKK